MLFNDIHNTKLILKLSFYDNIPIIIIIIIIYNLIKLFLNSKTKLKTIFIIIIFLIILYLDERAYTNKKFSIIKKNFNEIKSELNTGDIVMFRCYELTSIHDCAIFKLLLLPFIQETYFSHIGMIYKDSKGNINILESNLDYHFCNLNKKKKNGTMMLDYDNRFKNLKNYRVHVIKTNLYKFININKLNESIIKYKDYNFYENTIYCVTYILKLLEENGLYKMNKMDKSLYLPIDILDKSNYNCDIIFEEPITIVDIN